MILYIEKNGNVWLLISKHQNILRHHHGRIWVCWDLTNHQNAYPRDSGREQNHPDDLQPEMWHGGPCLDIQGKWLPNASYSHSLQVAYKHCGETSPGRQQSLCFFLTAVVMCRICGTWVKPWACDNDFLSPSPSVKTAGGSDFVSVNFPQTYHILVCNRRGCLGLLTFFYIFFLFPQNCS